MPETPVYALPYETETDIPGKSLRFPGPILAEEVEGELVRIDSSVTTLDGSFSALESTVDDRARTIDTINSGSGTNTTEFSNIPQTFRDLQIIWYGESDGAGEIDSLALRFNGDAGDNYDSRLSRNTGSSFTSSTDTFSVLRAGHVGTYRSVGTVWIPNYATVGKFKFASGVSYSRGQSSSTSTYTTQAGGHWTGTAAITSIRIWISSQLWVGDPHITLIGHP